MVLQFDRFGLEGVKVQISLYDTLRKQHGVSGVALERFVALASFESLTASSHPTGSQAHAFTEVQVISMVSVTEPPTAGINIS